VKKKEASDPTSKNRIKASTLKHKIKETPIHHIIGLLIVQFKDQPTFPWIVNNIDHFMDRNKW
jgi:hypothetical protein